MSRASPPFLLVLLGSGADGLLPLFQVVSDWVAVLLQFRRLP